MFELALAYIGAWMFNLLVVVLPRLRSRDRVLAAGGGLIRRLSGVGLAMPAILAEGAQTRVPQQAPPPEDWLTVIGQRLPFGGPSPLHVPEGMGARAATWQEWIGDAVAKVESLNASLIPYYPFLEIELIGLVNDVVLSDFVDEGRTLASLPAPVNGDMSSLGRPLAEFMTACAALRAYHEHEVA